MIIIGRHSFISQATAKAHFAAMLARHVPGTPIGDPDAADLAHLIHRHPDSGRKIGSGVTRFEVRLNPPFNSKGFWIVRTDGSATDFSYLACCSGRGPTHRQQVLRALRAAIRPQIFDFIDRQTAPYFCAVTQAWLERGDVHIDHAPPNTFEALVLNFLLSRRLRLPDIPVSAARDGQIEPMIAEAGIAAAFEVFHREHAQLRIVSASVNVALAAANRPADYWHLVS